MDDYTISDERFRGTAYPWLVLYKGEPLRRAHGACTGFQRFKTAGAAIRWIEKRKKKRGLLR